MPFLSPHARRRTAAPCRAIFPLLLLILSGFVRAHAMPGEFDEAWRWVHFSEESGLPSDHVQGICEMHDGTVWVSTFGGMAWFDDYQWNALNVSEGLPPTGGFLIIGELHDSLIVAAGGRYYIGTKSGFRPLDISPTSGAAVVDGDRFLFIQHSSLFEYRGGAVVPFRPGRDLTDGRTITMMSTRSGSVWVNLVGGLYKWEEGKFICKIPVEVNPLGTALLAENADGTGLLTVELPFEYRGLWEWEKGKPLVRNRVEKADNVRAMDMSNAGEVVAVYPSDEVRVRIHGRWEQAAFSDPAVRDIVFVRFRGNGDLWVGTQHGLFLYRRSSPRWTYWNHPPPDLRNSVNEILKTREGDLWIATSDGIEVHRAGGRVDNIASVNGTPLFVVTGLAQDSSGNIWVTSGASFSGAFRFDGRRWEHFAVSGDSGGVRFHKVRVDHRGRVWLLGIGRFFPPLGENQPGAYEYDGTTFRRWGEEEGLMNGRVYAFADGRDGALWFGTFAGLSRWKAGVWRHWSPHHGLHEGRVFTVAVDPHNHPWFGDYDERSGLATIDDDDSVRYVTTADGLPSDRIWEVRFDERGTMWTATRAGLASCTNGVWTVYDEKSGLQHAPLWPVLPVGSEVYVGTAGKGVAILHPEEGPLPNPRIILEPPLSEGRNAVLRWKAFAWWGELMPGEILTRVQIDAGAWSPWQREFETQLAGPSPGEHRYVVQAKGMLGNFDAAGVAGAFEVPYPLHLRPVFFIPVGALGLAVVVLGAALALRRRRHGREIRRSEEKFRTVTEMTSSAIFIFQDDAILFVNSGAEQLLGRTKEEILALRMTDLVHPDDRAILHEREIVRSGSTSVPQRYECRVLTAAGETKWVDFTSGWIRFQGMPMRLGTALDVTERKFAEEKLRLLASELSETEERERRRLASYLHDTIGQALAFSKMKIRLLQKSPSPQELGERLQELRELIEQSIADTRSLTYELSPPILYDLDFTAALEWLVNQFAKKHNLLIVLEDDKRPKAIADELRVFLFHAVREVLVNVAKHAGATRVTVTLCEQVGEIRIRVEDDGCGFDLRRSAMARSEAGGPIGGQQSGAPGAGPGLHGGFGLFNIRERLRHLGGRLDIDSAPGRGTRVSLSVPLRTVPPPPAAPGE